MNCSGYLVSKCVRELPSVKFEGVVAPLKVLSRHLTE